MKLRWLELIEEEGSNRRMLLRDRREESLKDTRWTFDLSHGQLEASNGVPFHSAIHSVRLKREPV